MRAILLPSPECMIAFATKKEERIKIMKLSEKPENAFSGESIPELTAITIAMIEAKKIDNTWVSTANMAHKNSRNSMKYTVLPTACMIGYSINRPCLLNMRPE